MNRNKCFFMLVMIITVLTMPQNIEAKEKKVVYLGHQYKGEVDQNKVPAGNGTININGLCISGIFEGSNVTDAKVTKTQETAIDALFSGKVKFDETNNITLEKGGILSCRYLQKTEKRRCHMELKEDKIVNFDNFDPTEIYIPYNDDYYKISKVLNPPIVKREKAIWRSKIDWWGNGKMEYGFKIDQDVSAFPLSKLDGYKDEQGRVWDFEDYGFGSEEYKVTYPNGSFYHIKYTGGAGSPEWIINYPDGNKLMFDVNGYSIDGVVYVVEPWNNGSAESFMELLNKSSLPKGHFVEKVINRVKVKAANLSTAEIGERIEKTLAALVDNPELCEKAILNISNDNKWYGEIENGKYISQEEVDKRSKVEKQKNAAAYKKQMEPWVKRFGFNPDGLTYKQVIKSGKSFKLLCDWYGLLRSNKSPYVQFTLSIDKGSSKCYDLSRVNEHYRSTKIGYIWVSGDKVTTVVWY